MKPVDQICKHDPDAGLYGDCFRACVASLLELPAETVPHFLEDNCDNETFWNRVNDFLRDYGLCMMTFGEIDFAEWRKVTGIKNVFHTIDGPSPRGDWWHSVVGCDGEIIHDPHPTKAGLVGTDRTFGLIVSLCARAAA